MNATPIYDLTTLDMPAVGWDQIVVLDSLCWTVVLDTCIALTSVNLESYDKLTHKVPKNSPVLRHTSPRVSQKHSHGCHCTTGDIIVFQACPALTSLNLSDCKKLTGKAKETSHPQAHLTHTESRL